MNILIICMDNKYQLTIKLMLKVYLQTGKVTIDTELTGYQKRTADKGIEKIQDDIMALHEAYQFLMKKYK